MKFLLFVLLFISTKSVTQTTTYPLTRFGTDSTIIEQWNGKAKRWLVLDSVNCMKVRSLGMEQQQEADSIVFMAEKYLEYGKKMEAYIFLIYADSLYCQSALNGMVFTACYWAKEYQIREKKTKEFYDIYQKYSKEYLRNKERLRVEASTARPKNLLQ